MFTVSYFSHIYAMELKYLSKKAPQKVQNLTVRGFFPIISIESRVHE